LAVLSKIPERERNNMTETELTIEQTKEFLLLAGKMAMSGKALINCRAMDLSVYMAAFETDLNNYNKAIFDEVENRGK
jgi:hypothetical protein